MIIYPIIKEADVDIVNSKENFCEFCGLKNTTIYDVEYYENNQEKCIALCEICRSIVVYDKCKQYRTIFIKSKLSQRDVITGTLKHYKKNGSIPSPVTLDPDSKRVDVSSHYLKLLASNEQKIYSYLAKIGVVSFINPEFKLIGIVPRNMSLGKRPNKTYWDDIEKMEIFKIKKDFDKLCDGAINKINNTKNIEIIKASVISMKDKVAYVNKNYIN